jgi:hypothetical protein
MRAKTGNGGRIAGFYSTSSPFLRPPSALPDRVRFPIQLRARHSVIRTTQPGTRLFPSRFFAINQLVRHSARHEGGSVPAKADQPYTIIQFQHSPLLSPPVGQRLSNTPKRMLASICARSEFSNRLKPDGSCCGPQTDENRVAQVSKPAVSPTSKSAERAAT